MNKLLKVSKDLSKYVNTKDSNDLSALDYCRINGNHAIFSIIKSFSTDGIALIIYIEYIITPISYKIYEESESDLFNEITELENYVKELNTKLSKSDNPLSIPDFQYNSAFEEQKYIGCQKTKEVVWIDTIKELDELSLFIINNSKVIGVDLEYYTFEKVNYYIIHRTYY